MMDGIGQLQAGQGIAEIESRVKQIEGMLARFQVKQAPVVSVPESVGKFASDLALKTKPSIGETSFANHLQSNSFSLNNPSLEEASSITTPLESLSSLSSLNAMNSILKIQAPENQSGPENSKSSIQSLIATLSGQYGIDNKLIQAIVKQESGFNPDAVSSSGAIGLMQLMPETARSLGVQNPANPSENLEGGIKYLKQMLSKFNGNIPLALAAYNAGPNAVAKHGGIPPYAETQQYVKSILKLYLSSKQTV